MIKKKGAEGRNSLFRRMIGGSFQESTLKDDIEADNMTAIVTEEGEDRLAKMSSLRCFLPSSSPCSIHDLKSMHLGLFNLPMYEQISYD